MHGLARAHSSVGLVPSFSSRPRHSLGTKLELARQIRGANFTRVAAVLHIQCGGLESEAMKLSYYVYGKEACR